MLKPLSKLMKDTSKLFPFLPETENILPPEEEIENYVYGMSLIYLPHPENLMLNLKSTKSPSTLNSNGSSLPLKTESKSGTLFLLTITLFSPSNLTLLPTLKNNNLLNKKPRTLNYPSVLLLPGTL